jgi:hypothetical protein
MSGAISRTFKHNRSFIPFNRTRTLTKVEHSRVSPFAVLTFDDRFKGFCSKQQARTLRSEIKSPVDPQSRSALNLTNSCVLPFIVTLVSNTRHPCPFKYRRLSLVSRAGRKYVVCPRQLRDRLRTRPLSFPRLSGCVSDGSDFVLLLEVRHSFRGDFPTLSPRGVCLPSRYGDRCRPYFPREPERSRSSSCVPLLSRRGLRPSSS